MTGNHYSVGERVRVTSVKDGTSQRGIIACCNVDESFDIIYDAKFDSRSDQSDEEFSVQPSRVASLIFFELSDHTINLPSEMKEYGNTLFKLKDYDAAIQYYKAGVASMLSSRKVRCMFISTTMKHHSIDAHRCYAVFQTPTISRSGTDVASDLIFLHEFQLWCKNTASYRFQPDHLCWFRSSLHRVKSSTRRS